MIAQLVFNGLQQRFPELWSANRLRMIPAGELFYELDQQFREGKVLGIADIREFYTDVQLIRAVLPRYTVAALMFASSSMNRRQSSTGNYTTIRRGTVLILIMTVENRKVRKDLSCLLIDSLAAVPDTLSAGRLILVSPN